MRPGLFGNRVANFAIQSCDLLLILGSRLSVPITGSNKKFSQNQKIYIDIDKHEIIKRDLKTSDKVISDLDIFLKKFNEFINKKQIIKKLNGKIKKIKN